MRSKDVEVLLQIRGVKKSDLARMLEISRQHIYQKFQKDGFRQREVEKILNELNIELKCTYIDKETKDIIYQSRI